MANSNRRNFLVKGLSSCSCSGGNDGHCKSSQG